MSNEVWVTWDDPEGTNKLSALVENLRDGAIIDHLKKAFVKQQEPDIKRPAAIEVRVPRRAELLTPGTKLKDYFVDDQDEKNKDKPGRSEGTALVLTLPSSSTRTVSLFCIVC